MSSPVEPRAHEQLALSDGWLPSTLEVAIASVDASRLGDGEQRD
jgi:hypothetical protein